MFVETVGVVGSGLTIYNNRSLLARLFKELRLLITMQKKMVVFGCGGTGKTTFEKYLLGGLNKVGEYQESFNLVQSKAKIDGEIPCSVFVPPGQERRRPQTWPALFKMISSGNVDIIINVCSYGYHSTGLDYARFLEKQGIVDGESVISKYSEKQRQEELSALLYLAPHLKVSKNPIHMLTLVTKQDLWWPVREDVMDFYKKKEYGLAISSIEAALGKNNFSHHFSSVSFVRQNLATQEDQRLIAPVSAGYDDQLQHANLAEFLRYLKETLNRSKS